MNAPRMGVIVLGAFMLAYPISVGPVAARYQTRNAPYLLHEVYFPLLAVASKFETAENILEWYCKLWRTNQ